jgi:hypothetical protein
MAGRPIGMVSDGFFEEPNVFPVLGFTSCHNTVNNTANHTFKVIW